LSSWTTKAREIALFLGFLPDASQQKRIILPLEQRVSTELTLWQQSQDSSTTQLVLDMLLVLADSISRSNRKEFTIPCVIVSANTLPTELTLPQEPIQNYLLQRIQELLSQKNISSEGIFVTTHVRLLQSLFADSKDAGHQHLLGISSELLRQQTNVNGSALAMRVLYQLATSDSLEEPVPFLELLFAASLPRYSGSATDGDATALEIEKRFVGSFMDIPFNSPIRLICEQPHCME
jgi:hypothetical protein